MTSPPILATLDPAPGTEPARRANRKCFVASLLRTLYSGRIVTAGAGDDLPLFKAERSQVEEMHLEAGEAGEPRERGLCLVLQQCVRPGPEEWVLVADPASVALRNIDHLLPPDIPGPHPPAPVDFLCGGKPIGNISLLSARRLGEIPRDHDLPAPQMPQERSTEQLAAHPPSAGAGRVQNRGHRQQFPTGLPVIFRLQRSGSNFFASDAIFSLRPGLRPSSMASL